MRVDAKLRNALEAAAARTRKKNPAWSLSAEVQRRLADSVASNDQMDIAAAYFGGRQVFAMMQLAARSARWADEGPGSRGERWFDNAARFEIALQLIVRTLEQFRPAHRALPEGDLFWDKGIANGYGGQEGLIDAIARGNVGFVVDTDDQPPYPPDRYAAELVRAPVIKRNLGPLFDRIAKRIPKAQKL